MQSERKKLWEILNNAKATLERTSLTEAWSKLQPEMASAPESLKAFLRTEYDYPEALKIYNKVTGNLFNKRNK